MAAGEHESSRARRSRGTARRASPPAAAAPSRRIRPAAARCRAAPSTGRPPRRWCACVLARACGSSSSSWTVPSMRARTKPCAASSSSTCACSPLRSLTTGASSTAGVPSGSFEHLVDHLADRLRREIDAVVRAARDAGARVQQAQVVVDLGDGADGRARVVRGRLLLDRDRRRQALDPVDVGLVHHGQELARVGRQRLDVAALAFGIERVEGERGLAGTGQAGEHDQPVARQVEVRFLRLWVRAPRMRMYCIEPSNGTRGRHLDPSRPSFPRASDRSGSVALA